MPAAGDAIAFGDGDPDIELPAEEKSSTLTRGLFARNKK